MDFSRDETVYHHKFGSGRILSGPGTKPGEKGAYLVGFQDRERLVHSDYLSRDSSNVVPLYAKVLADRASSVRKLPQAIASNLAGRDVPVREWHVENMIPRRTVTLFFGDGGAGKSLAILQLAVATVTRSIWLGLGTASGRVLFLSAEDDMDEIHRRLNDIILAVGDIGYPDLADLKLVPLAGEDAVLGAPTKKGAMIEPTPLWAPFQAEAKAWKPALIIIDTLADVFGGEENARAQARQFIGMLRGLALETGAAVVVLAHPSLGGMASGSGTSGSTGWSNSVRSRLYLKRALDESGVELDPDIRVLSVMKANYGRVGAEMRLRWQDGVFVVVDEPTVSGSNSIAAQARAERVFLDMLDAYTIEGRSLSATPSANYAPSVFAKDSRSAGTTKKALVTAMNYLFQTRHIAIEEYGPPSRRLKRIARVVKEE